MRSPKMLAAIAVAAMIALCLNVAMAWDGNSTMKVGLTHIAPNKYPSQGEVVDLWATANLTGEAKAFDLENDSLVRPILGQFLPDGSAGNSMVDNFISASLRGEGPFVRSMS